MPRSRGDIATKTSKSTANGVSVNNDDCPEGFLDSAYDVSTNVESAASNPSLSCSKFPQNSVECLDRQPSLQELIEAELTARFAPLQPDSLEGLVTREYHEHTRTIINGNEVTSSCTALLDSLEEQPFSLDSLADVESGVDLTSPHNPNSGDHSPIPPNPLPDDSSNFSVNVNDLSVFNHNHHISNTVTESNSFLIDSSHNHHNHHHHTNNFVQSQPNLPEEHRDLNVSDNVDGSSIDHVTEVNISQNSKKNSNPQIFINGLNDEQIDTSVPVALEYDSTFTITDSAQIDDNDEEFVKHEKLIALECENEILHDNDVLLEVEIETNDERHTASDVVISEDIKISCSSEEIDLLSSENALKIVENSSLSNDSQKLENNDSFSSSVGNNFEQEIESVTNLDSDKTNADLEIVSVSSPLEISIEEYAKSNGSAAVEEKRENIVDETSDVIDQELNTTENSIENITTKHETTAQNLSLLNGVAGEGSIEPKSEDKGVEYEAHLLNGDAHPVEQIVLTESKDIGHHFIPDLSFDVTNSQNAINVNKFSETRSANDLNVAKTSELPSFNVTNGVDEELWPEETTSSSKALFDDFEQMEQEVILEMEKENEENKTKKEVDKKSKKKRKKKSDSEKENKSSITEDDFEETLYDENFVSHNLIGNKNSDLIRSGSPHLSEEDTALNVSFNEDDLSNISVKQLTASYLSCTGQQRQQQKQRSSTPVRSRTPISQLVEAYSPPPSYSRTSTPVKNTPSVKNGDEVSNTYPPDFTPVASLKSLKSAYESNANKTSPTSNESLSVKEEVQVSFSQLREAYCNVAFAQQDKGSTTPRSVTPSKIRSNIAPVFQNMEPTQVSSDCRICGKQVFQMEKIVAEKASWHKNCFRCKECNKNLTLETYQSHEGSLYCKPHFKELFRPKAVVQDEAEERKERSTSKPDYGLEELQQTLNVKERFAVFENFSKEEEKPRPEPISVRRSQSLMSKAASRFFDGQEDGEEYEDDEDVEEEEEEEVEDEEMEDEEGEGEDQEGSVVKMRNKKKKERPMSFSGMGDLKAAWEQKQRREELSQSRKEEISRFRQMLCAGKNLSLKEKFESGQFDDHENGETNRMKEEIKIEGKRAASNLKKRFEQGEPFILEDDDEVDGEEGIPKRRERVGSEKQEVEEIFKEAETAKKARNVFRQIDSKVSKEGTTILRSQSFASSGRENRHSIDRLMGDDEAELLGRDPNLIKCSDNYQDDIDCRNTKNILQMFKKMEMGEEEEEEEEEGPKPLKRFTPPPGEENENDESEEFSDEYTDEEEEDEEESDPAPNVKDELLQMSARKAASLRAKFERWETEVARQNDINKDKEEVEEGMPSLDTAKNLKAMFEHKAIEVAKPVASKPIKQKVNRFVGGGGEKCVSCGKTVYVMEKLDIHGKILHKQCFKCAKCNTQLSMGSFSFGGGNNMYCITHYKQLFTEKGSYDAFTQEKGKWAKKIESINGDVKSHD